MNLFSKNECKNVWAGKIDESKKWGRWDLNPRLAGLPGSALQRIITAQQTHQSSHRWSPPRFLATPRPLDEGCSNMNITLAMLSLFRLTASWSKFLLISQNIQFPEDSLRFSVILLQNSELSGIVIPHSPVRLKNSFNSELFNSILKSLPFQAG